jgi:hypothetical protein
MSRPSVLLAFMLVSLVGCQGQNRQQPSIGVSDSARVRERIPPPYTTNQVGLAEFRAQIPAGVDSGGRCREYAYAVQQWGLRGVAWRLDGPDRRFWRIDVAIDSTGAVRRYYEDRYGYVRAFLIANGLLLPFIALQMYVHWLIWIAALWAVTFPGSTCSLAILFWRARPAAT